MLVAPQLFYWLHHMALTLMVIFFSPNINKHNNNSHNNNNQIVLNIVACYKILLILNINMD